MTESELAEAAIPEDDDDHLGFMIANIYPVGQLPSFCEHDSPDGIFWHLRNIKNHLSEGDKH
jgi:hypothetical protein